MGNDWYSDVWDFKMNPDLTVWHDIAKIIPLLWNYNFYILFSLDTGFTNKDHTVARQYVLCNHWTYVYLSDFKDWSQGKAWVNDGQLLLVFFYVVSVAPVLSFLFCIIWTDIWKICLLSTSDGGIILIKHNELQLRRLPLTRHWLQFCP